MSHKNKRVGVIYFFFQEKIKDKRDYCQEISKKEVICFICKRFRIPKEIGKQVLQDMIDFGAEVCVYTCSMCLESLGSKARRNGLKNYLLSDLCRLALGEELTY